MAASGSAKLGWGLALRLARREMRHGFSGFRIFFLCLVLGISTISAVGSLSASMVAGMAAQGQAILGGDMDFRLVHREASDTELAWLDGQADLSRMATMRAMVRHEQATLLVEAKAVDNIYPLYGAVTLAAGGALAPALAAEEPKRHREKFTARLPRAACSTGLTLRRARLCNWAIFACA